MKALSRWAKMLWRALLGGTVLGPEVSESLQQAYREANDSLVGWLFILHAGYRQQADWLTDLQVRGLATEEQLEELTLSQAFMLELEELAVWVSSHEDGQWVRLRTFTDHLHSRWEKLLRARESEERIAVLMSLENKCRGMLADLPAEAR